MIKTFICDYEMNKNLKNKNLSLKCRKTKFKRKHIYRIQLLAYKKNLFLKTKNIYKRGSLISTK